MNLAQIEEAARLRFVDAGLRRQWTSAEIRGFANQAEREACERANLIEDSTTAAVCEIAGLADTATYALHAKIISISSVTWDGRFLDPIARNELNRLYPNGWKTRTSSRPSHFIDPQQRSLTLSPIPTAAADIELVAYRYPLVDMTADADSPEIPERFHFDLLDWIEHLAYQKDDTEALNINASQRAAERFAQKFGVKIDANTRRTQRARTPNVVRMNPHW